MDTPGALPLKSRTGRAGALLPLVAVAVLLGVGAFPGPPLHSAMATEYPPTLTRSDGFDGPPQPVTGPIVKTVAALTLNFQNDASQPWTPAQVRDTIFTSERSTRAYYEEASFHQWTLQGLQNRSGDVFGWFTVPFTNQGCKENYREWTNAAATQASAAGVNLEAYDKVVYLFQADRCVGGGWAFVGGHEAWVTTLNSKTVAHELGHAFGWQHANSLRCTDATGAPVAISLHCNANEYGDPFDVMGEGFRHPSNYHKGQLGWLPPNATRTVTSDGTYTLFPVEAAATGYHVLRVPRNVTASGIVENYYYLEFREAGGFDDFRPGAPIVNGVTIRLAPDYAKTERSRLIDTTPLTPSFADAPLVEGETFTDPFEGITISTQNTRDGYALVRVAFAGDRATSSNATASRSNAGDTMAKRCAVGASGAAGQVPASCLPCRVMQLGLWSLAWPLTSRAESPPSTPTKIGPRSLFPSWFDPARGTSSNAPTRFPRSSTS